MSKILSAIGVQVVENTDTLKRRVMLEFFKDEICEVKLIMSAEEAEHVATELVRAAAEARSRKIIPI